VPSEPRPPGWGNENVWHEAIDRYRLATQPEPDRSVLLHRDFHPLNLLWEDGAIVGVVDWVNACTGHPHAELGHCRWNLTALAGLEAADQFLAHYLRATGSGPYDYWWDLTAALGFLDWPVAVQAWQAVGRTDITDATIARVTNAFLRAALDHLHLA
jgi:aminoglycoside phosphotransferase (APT) family kinase protein